MRWEKGQPRWLWDLVRRQHGVVTRFQLLAGDLDEAAIDSWIRRGRLHPIHAGVYAVGRPELSSLGRWQAAVLACGRRAALSHESAAALWQLIPQDVGPPHVSTPVGRHPRCAEIRTHRRSPMPPLRTEQGIRATDPIWTLIDCAPKLPIRRLEAAVNEADRRGLLDLSAVDDLVESLPRRAGVRKLRSVLTSHVVTDSDLERVFLGLVSQVGIPKPRTQVELLGFRVDFIWTELGLVVETDGLTFHRTPAQQTRDRARDQALTAAGFTVLRFTNAQVRRERALIARTLLQTVTRLQASVVQKPAA